MVSFFVLLGQFGMALTLVQGPRQFNATFIKSRPTSISGRSVSIYGRAVQISGRSEKNNNNKWRKRGNNSDSCPGT